MKYNVWITLFSSSAKNAGIIGGYQHTKTSYASGQMAMVPINDGSQVNFTFEAKSDADAFATVTRLFNERNPRNRRPLSGKSYIRECRIK